MQLQPHIRGFKQQGNSSGVSPVPIQHKQSQEGWVQAARWLGELIARLFAFAYLKIDKTRVLSKQKIIIIAFASEM